MATSRVQDAEERMDLLELLRVRFITHMYRHIRVKWEDVEEKLSEQPDKLWSLAQMEATGGEPDVIADEETDHAIIFFDCSAETPKNRRSLCYDDKAWQARKENKPASSAQKMADEMGVALLDEEQYRLLQKLEQVDLKTSSWLQTPDKIRDLGGALFGDCRYDTVFVYHNGAESYYAARGFRAYLSL